MLVDLRGLAKGKRITDLARDLAIPKSSAFQIAATMVHHGILECDDDTRRYRLGPTLHSFIAGPQGRRDLPLLAVPHLRGLADATGLTALLGVPTGSGTVLVAKADSPEPLGVGAPVGFELDRMAGAFGKIFAAARDDAGRTALLRKKLPRYTARSVIDPREMECELARIRKSGVAIDREEYLDGIRAVAAPVTDETGDAIAAVCALGVAARLKRDRLPRITEQVRAAAQALSRDLGGGAIGGGSR
jgi:IclR family acetate operon transcriptional repressor